jgi:hypothetical protein
MTKIMDGHPAVCGPFPSHMMRTFCKTYFLYGDARNDRNWEELTTDVAEYLDHIFAQWESKVTSSELRERCTQRTLAEIIRYVYEKEANARGKNRLFVKENHAYQFLTFTATQFPTSRFVWVVRDPRDMALCQRDSILAGGVQTAVIAWKNDQAGSLKAYGYLRDTGRMALVKFEELLQRPEETIRQVCDHLQLAYDPQMLEFHKNPNVSKNASTVSAWSDLAKPIIADNFDNYKTGLSEDEIRFVEAYCKEEMETLGYALEFEPGDVETVRARLADESTFDRERSPQEKARYEPYFEMMKRLQARWAKKGAVLG